MADDDYTPQEMVDWLRQKDDVRVCQSHGINMCRVNPSPREMFAAKQIEALMARIAELESLLRQTNEGYAECIAAREDLKQELACSIVSGNDARERCLEHVYALSAAALRIAELEGDLARERSTTTCVPRGWK